MSDNKITKYGTQAGKGDTPRKVKGEKYRANFDLIFRAVKTATQKDDN